MIKFHQYFYERDDYKNANRTLLLAEKIMKYFKTNFDILSKKLFKKEDSYYFPVSIVDKRYMDLYIILSEIKHSHQGQIGGHSQMNKLNFISLYLLNDETTIDNPKFKNVLFSDKIKSVLVHELTHYLDTKKYKNNDVSKKLANKQFNLDFSAEDEAKQIKAFAQYFNFSAEINARWNEAIVKFVKFIKKPENKHAFDFLDNKDMYNALEKWFISSFGENEFKLLTDKNQKRIKKRFYMFIQELIDIGNKKQTKIKKR